MSPRSTMAQIRTKNILECSATAVETLEILSRSLGTPFLGAISSTTRSLLKVMETIKQNKQDCIQLVEQTHEVLNAILVVHVESDTGELPPVMLKQIGEFTETLYKIHTFVEAQQEKHILKNIFRHGEMGTLLNECKAGLQQGLDSFQIQAVNFISDAREVQQVAQNRLQEVLDMIEALSDASISDRAPSVKRDFYGSSDRYEQQRFFIACDSVTTKVELAAIIGSHVGLKLGKDLTGKVIHHFSTSPPCLLILDNLETSWEPQESREDVEELLSSLADVTHLALVITLRGAERPGKVQWTRPFLPPLTPLEQDSAREMFLDIADDGHDIRDVDKVLQLADNMPLAIDLLAHLADSEGCPNVLSRWETEKTSLISVGWDRRDNLDLSIALSLSSPRIISKPDAKNLLSLLSMLPNGLTDAELLHSKLPLDNVLSCKSVLIRTSLVLIDKGRLKALVPIREYMQKLHPAAPDLVSPIRHYFQQLLEIYDAQLGNQGISEMVSRISSNYANIQQVLSTCLQPKHPALVDSIYCTCSLNNFSRLTSQKKNVLMDKIPTLIPHLSDHRLKAYYIVELFSSWIQQPVSNPGTLIANALEHFKHFDDPDLKWIFHPILFTPSRN
ncbi:hypothetical protein C8R43DRAFT_1191653 [Mycena crocata]|nr:hypothetical protein C8R43DRAFT_1191653 [Mycena crocata]